MRTNVRRFVGAAHTSVLHILCTECRCWISKTDKIDIVIIIKVCSIQYIFIVYRLIYFFLSILWYFFLVSVITSESQILSKQHERKYMQTSIKISNSSYQLNCDRCTRKRKNEHIYTHTHQQTGIHKNTRTHS